MTIVCLHFCRCPIYTIMHNQSVQWVIMVVFRENSAREFNMGTMYE